MRGRKRSLPAQNADEPAPPGTERGSRSAAPHHQLVVPGLGVGTHPVSERLRGWESGPIPSPPPCRASSWCLPGLGVGAFPFTPGWDAGNGSRLVNRPRPWHHDHPPLRGAGHPSHKAAALAAPPLGRSIVSRETTESCPQGRPSRPAVPARTGAEKVAHLTYPRPERRARQNKGRHA